MLDVLIQYKINIITASYNWPWGQLKNIVLRNEH